MFEVGSALCGAANSSTMLIVGRAVAGLGASGLLNGGYTVVALIVPLERQAGRLPPERKSATITEQTVQGFAVS